MGDAARRGRYPEEQQPGAAEAEPRGYGVRLGEGGIGADFRVE